VKKFFNNRLAAFGYAISGIVQFVRDGVHPIFQMSAAAVAILVGFWFGLNSTEWMLMTLVIGFVIVSEMFNSAMESLSDIVSEKPHPQIKKVKDIAAGAVLIAAIVAMVFAIVFLLPKFLMKIAQI
jgi:diacylglycerol kinase